MDPKTVITQTSKNPETLSHSPSGFNLDPDPVTDGRKVLYGSIDAASGNIITQLFSNMINAARRAVESVFSKFFSSAPDAEPLIEISKPRNLRRNENELPTAWKEANDAARSNYYYSLFKPEPSKVGTADIHTQQASQMPDLSTSTPEQVANVEGAKQVEASIGEKTFQQYFTLFQDKEGDMLFSSGYFAFTPECLDYAKKLAKLAIGKDVSTIENSEIIRAARFLVNGEIEIRLAQDQLAAQEVRKQEKLAKIEEQKTKRPGQSDFEEFFAIYQKHVDEKTPVILVEGSKFLSVDCLAYADTIEPDPQFIEGEKKVTVASAAAYLFMWKANPTEALEKARADTDFQMPPPPEAPLSRLKGVDVPVLPMTWESAVSNLQWLSDANRSQLASILFMRSKELEQAFKGLSLAAEYAVKPLIVASASEQTRPAQLGLPPDGRLTDIDLLQQAKSLLAKARLAKKEDRLKGVSELAVLLESGQRIDEMIDLRLATLLPKRKQANAVEVFKILDIASLSAEEMNAASKDFEKFVTDFMKAGKEDRVYKIQPTSKYLAPAIVAIANNFLELVGKVPGLELNDADTERMKAAGYLVNAAQRLAVRKT